MMIVWISFGLLFLFFGLFSLIRWAQKRGLGPWVFTEIQQVRTRTMPGKEEKIHILICLADHFEPKAKGKNLLNSKNLVENWIHDYFTILGHFRDSDHRPPRHTFFYPEEEYDPELLDLLKNFCKKGFGEVEIHSHHDRENACRLREKLREFRNHLANRHQLLGRWKTTGEPAFGFVHGNWALANSGKDGQWCGVDGELQVLTDCGCYADFTFPSVPDPPQPRKINRPFYVSLTASGPGCLDHGWDVQSSPQPENSFLLIPGPLTLIRPRFGLPKIENGCLQNSQPPSMERLDNWIKARVQVPTRPDWFFIKLHCHGAEETSRESLLGPPMVAFHQNLARLAEQHPNFHYHYVTAREMYNLVKAAEAGWKGHVEEARDFLISPPPDHGAPQGTKKVFDSSLNGPLRSTVVLQEMGR